MLNVIRRGAGVPLLLVHGLGGTWRSWTPVLEGLTPSRELIVPDLLGHGDSPAGPDAGTFLGQVGAVEALVAQEGLAGVDAVGSSMGARIVLELARRGVVRHAVALDPGGFWRGWERTYFAQTIGPSIGLLRALGPRLRGLARSRAARTALLAQLSAHPWRLDPDFVATELENFAATKVADALVRDLAHGPEQRGPAAPSTGTVALGWGRWDRLCLPRQAARALAAFPSARLTWFPHSGHFPMWDEPEETVRFVLESLAGTARPAGSDGRRRPAAMTGSPGAT